MIFPSFPFFATKTLVFVQHFFVCKSLCVDNGMNGGVPKTIYMNGYKEQIRLKPLRCCLYLGCGGAELERH